jgi:hypothetical protein
MYTYIPNIQEAELGESQVQGQPRLFREFEATLHYIALSQKKSFR